MSSKIVDRVLRRLGAPRLVDDLAALTPNDLTSLLLAVFRARSARLDAGELLRQAARDLVRPFDGDARVHAAFDAEALRAAAAFEAIELSPVAPLGINVLLGRIDQNNTLAAARNVEVQADPTTAMALVSALRRRARREGEVKLCTSHRMVRLQPFDHPDFRRHFRLFAMTTAGRDRGGHAFEAAALREHLGVYLGLVAALRAAGFRPGPVEVLVTARGLEARVEADVFPPLAAAHPDVRFRLDDARTQGLGYYAGACLTILVGGMPIGDGGFTDWTQRLLADRKERLLVSGFGTELFCRHFR